MKIINAKVFTEDCTFEEKDICISKEYISHSSGDDAVSYTHLDVYKRQL